MIVACAQNLLRKNVLYTNASQLHSAVVIIQLLLRLQCLEFENPERLGGGARHLTELPRCLQSDPLYRLAESALAQQL